MRVVRTRIPIVGLGRASVRYEEKKKIEIPFRPGLEPGLPYISRVCSITLSEPVVLKAKNIKKRMKLVEKE